MRLLLSAHVSFRALFVLTLLTGLLSHGFIVQAQDPSIVLDAGNGQTAELTAFSLANYVQNPSGSFSGDFCITLRNTSFTSAPQLPIYLTGVGMLGSGGAPSAVAQSYPESFTDDVVAMVDGIDEPLDWLIVARNAPGVLGSFENLLNGPTDGIAYQSSGTFCFRVTRAQPFTADDLLENVVVLFSDEIAACFATDETAEAVHRYASVHIDTFSETELSLRVTNRDVLSPTPQRIVGAAFEVSEGTNDYNLAPDPPPILGDLSFTGDRNRLSKTLKLGDTKFDFGLIRGRKEPKSKGPAGLRPYETATFGVEGNFAGTTTDRIFRDALVRFADGWATQSDGCGFLIPGGEAIRGAVATVPR